MTNQAHGMRLDHAIFNSPLKVEIKTEAIDSPYVDGGKLAAWKVHEGTHPEIDVGLVADGFGFDDSPDAEWISSGVNTKGAKSVALGRHANYFLWGFFGDADRLTPSARKVFVNTICYMSRFSGQRPLVTRQGQGREAVYNMIAYLRTKHARQVSGFIKKIIPAEVIATTKMDADKLDAYFNKNLEYVRFIGNKVTVDADLAKLGISSRKPAFLQTMANRLARDANDAVAKRLIARYVRPEGFKDAAAFRAWLGNNRGKLFFSDVGGYRWFVNTHPARPEGAKKVTKTSCLKCKQTLVAGSAFRCEKRCSFCETCTKTMDFTCPNCGGRLKKEDR